MLHITDGDCSNRESCTLLLDVATHNLSTSKFRSILVLFIVSWFSLLQVAYSYDAGPNAVLFVESKNVPELLSLIKYYFPPTEEQSK